MKSYNGFTPEQRYQGDAILKDAISKGVIPAPNTRRCCLCGQAEGILHYHNEDYTPEHVVTDARVVCWRCHMMIHSRFRHPQSFAKYMIQVTMYGMQFPPVYKGNDWDVLKEHYID